MDVIQENVSVILQRGKVLKAVKLQAGKKMVFEKLHFMPDKAFSEPYNSWFQVANNALVKVENEPTAPSGAEDNNVLSEAAATEQNESVEDNRLLVDSHGKSQSMQREQIVNLKRSGAKGEDIVNEIVKNSSTFSSKTTYSQKKYLKKKHKKHLTNICILKPCSRLLCKMYEGREPAKICQMQFNTLAQIVTMANIHHGCKVAVVETCSGVLLSLIMERLGGAGGIVNLHTGETPTNFHAASHMNFPESYWKLLHSLPLCKVGPSLANVSFEDAVGEIVAEEPPKSITHPATGQDIQMENSSSKKDKKFELTEEQKCKIRTQRRRRRLFHQKSAWDMLNAKDLDAVIIACKYHPTPIFMTLLEFLSPSRPFVVHCENQEPLMELFVQLSITGKAVNLKISETFTRQYQVLPDQTHPLVTMNTNGGYLLTGIKVIAHTQQQKQKRISPQPDEVTQEKRAKLEK